jgi:hypothetical protein
MEIRAIQKDTVSERRKIITFLKESEASPACPSDRSSMKIKTVEW